MDPLGAAASIIAVLQLTQSAIKYVKDASGATEDRDRIHAELEDIERLLHVLQINAEQLKSGDACPAALQCLCEPDGPLAHFRAMLEKISRIMRPTKGLRSAKAAVTWPFKKETVNEYLNALHRYKLLFMAAQQNDHM